MVGEGSTIIGDGLSNRAAAAQGTFARSTVGPCVVLQYRLRFQVAQPKAISVGFGTVRPATADDDKQFASVTPKKLFRVDMEAGQAVRGRRCLCRAD